MATRLAEVQLCWNPDDDSLPPVKIVRSGREDDDRYISSWGACNSDFNDATDDERLTMLLQQFIHLTVNEGVDPTALHEELLEITEYRRSLAEVGIADPGE